LFAGRIVWVIPGSFNSSALLNGQSEKTASELNLNFPQSPDMVGNRRIPPRLSELMK